MKNHPKLFMIGGPNGAGKTTSAFTLMPALIECSEYVNADSIATSLSPFKAAEVSVQAGKLMIQRIRVLAEGGASFTFEATMSSRGFAGFLKECRARGYHINLLYVWVSDVALAVARVQSRVLAGGHDIPEDVIRRRYYRSAYNFLNFYQPLADRWVFCDNSALEPTVVAERKEDSMDMNIYDDQLWNVFKEVGCGERA